jgi:hypothetical protein
MGGGALLDDCKEAWASLNLSPLQGVMSPPLETCQETDRRRRGLTNEGNITEDKD